MFISEAGIHISVVEGIMVYLYLLLLVSTSMVNASDVNSYWDESGKGKIEYKNLSLEQKVRLNEIRRDGAEYMLKNIGKKCSELTDVPDYVRKMKMPKKIFPNTVCFSKNKLPLIYRVLGKPNEVFKEKKRQHETAENRNDPYQMQDWLNTLIAYGHFTEAVAFFPQFVHSAYPRITMEEIKKKIESGEPLPLMLSHTIAAEEWDKVLAIRNKPDNLINMEEDGDIVLKMQRYYYSDEDTKREEALLFYRNNKVDFMVDKAHKTWTGILGNKAGKYYQELQIGTTNQ